MEDAGRREHACQWDKNREAIGGGQGNGFRHNESKKIKPARLLLPGFDPAIVHAAKTFTVSKVFEFNFPRQALAYTLAGG